jgi:signal transduction histidine kinase
MFRGDSQRLGQVFSNILANSLRFSSPGGEIRVVGNLEAPWIQISIIDSGAGISAEHLPHVFDRFWRAQRPSSAPYDGLGLGLAIAKEFVSLHGGTIEAGSEGLGKGAQFTIRLPQK